MAELLSTKISGSLKIGTDTEYISVNNGKVELVGLDKLELPSTMVGVLFSNKVNNSSIFFEEAKSKEASKGYNLILGSIPTITKSDALEYGNTELKEISNDNRKEYSAELISIGNSINAYSNEYYSSADSQGHMSYDLNNCTAATSSILIGNSIDAGATNSVVIGHNSSTSGGVVIGNNGRNTNGILITSAVNGYSDSLDGVITLKTTTTTATAPSNGSSWAVSSDKRDKTAFQDLTNALEFLLRLQPKTYQMNQRSLYKDSEGNFNEEDYLAATKKNERRVAGFIAQDVYQTLKDVYNSDNYAGIVDCSSYYDGKLDGDFSIHSDQFIPFIISAIQEQNKLIKKQEEKINELETQISLLKK